MQRTITLKMNDIQLLNIPRSVQKKHGIKENVDAEIVSSKTKSGKGFKLANGLVLDPDDLIGKGVEVKPKPPRLIS